MRMENQYAHNNCAQELNYERIKSLLVNQKTKSNLDFQLPDQNLI